MIMMLI